MRVLTILFYLICINTNSCLADLHLYETQTVPLFENSIDTYKFDISKFKDYSIDHKNFDIKLEYNNNCLGPNLSFKLNEKQKSYLGINFYYGLKPDFINIASLNKINVFNNNNLNSKLEVTYGLSITSTASNSIYAYDGSVNFGLKIYL